MLKRPERWMYRAALFTLVSGVLMAGAALFPGGLDLGMGLVFGSLEGVPLGAPARFAAGVAGAVLTGWGVTMAVLARDLATVDTPAVGRSFCLGLLSWFSLDGLVTLTLGAHYNLVGNTLFLAALLPPAWLLWRTPRPRER